MLYPPDAKSNNLVFVDCSMYSQYASHISQLIQKYTLSEISSKYNYHKPLGPNNHISRTRVQKRVLQLLTTHQMLVIVLCFTMCFIAAVPFKVYNLQWITLGSFIVIKHRLALDLHVLDYMVPKKECHHRNKFTTSIGWILCYHRGLES